MLSLYLYYAVERSVAFCAMHYTDITTLIVLFLIRKQEAGLYRKSIGGDMMLLRISV